MQDDRLPVLDEEGRYVGIARPVYLDLPQWTKDYLFRLSDAYTPPDMYGDGTPGDGTPKEPPPLLKALRSRFYWPTFYRWADGAYLLCSEAYRSIRLQESVRLSATELVELCCELEWTVPREVLDDAEKPGVDIERIMGLSTPVAARVASVEPKTANAQATSRQTAPPATEAQPTEAVVEGPNVEAAIAKADAQNEATPPDVRKELDNLFGRACKPRKVNKAEAEKRAHKYLYVDNLPWPGYRKLAEAISYWPSRLGELPSVQRFLGEHPDALPARSPKTAGITDTNEDSISVGERHEVLNAMIAKEKAEMKLAELVKLAEEQAAEHRADFAPRKYQGKTIGRRRKA